MNFAKYNEVVNIKTKEVNYLDNKHTKNYAQAARDVSSFAMSKSKKKASSTEQHTESRRRLIRLADGAVVYCMSRSKFRQMAYDAGAVYKIQKVVVVDLDIFDAYFESFRVPAN